MSNEIVKINSEMDFPDADRIGWVIEEIANAGISPRNSDSWSGRGEIVRAAQKNFFISPEEAEKLVSQATTDLWIDQGENPQVVERRLLKARLGIIRKQVIRSLGEEKSRTIMVSVKVKQPDGEIKSVWKPKKMEIKKGTDINAIRILIDIERMIAELDHLERDGKSGTQEVHEIFREISQGADGSSVQKTVASVRRTVDKLEGVPKMSDAGWDVIKDAMTQEGRKKTTKPKPVAKASDDIFDGEIVAGSGGLPPHAVQENEAE